MRVADFFCGAGGFSEGFRQSGFQVVFAVDKWLPAVNTHHENHPNGLTLHDDVEKISKLPDSEFHALVPDTEVIIGSPPCVAFSNSNKSGKGDKKLGIRLLESYLRIIARKKYKDNSVLKYWILENVPNIQKFIKPVYTSKDLNLEGDFELRVIYENSGVFNSKYFGVPQNRKRFLCGEFVSPKQVIKNDSDVIPLKYILEALGHPNNEMETSIKDPNYSFTLLSRNISDHHYIEEIADHEWKKAKQLKEDKGYMGRMSFPEDINKPARTVMATCSGSSRESIIYQYRDGRYRVPTIRELASIMSFPIDYKFYGESRGTKSRLVGNAVPPKMSYAFAKAIAEYSNLPIPNQYLPIQHANKIDFFNLNFEKFVIRKEKRKRKEARFKYHIPYLIINSYRVELTNYYSDFKNKKFVWETEIHKGQGKSAKVYKPLLLKEIFDQSIIDKINLFVGEIEPKLVSFNKFQLYHCYTTEERTELLGPTELLESIKVFLTTNFEEERLTEKITISEEPSSLPLATLVGFLTLQKIIMIMRGIKNE